ncbi:hypothetical protein OTU49_009420 [Cherax quadricarinatus]|uniref:Uncharacterized protein n=1 Tax=Cherax quadricarinatus TaxID=27406 RepID=A0AAW0WJ17_CHEQU
MAIVHNDIVHSLRAFSSFKVNDFIDRCEEDLFRFRLPLLREGLFSHDSFFANVRQIIDDALREMLMAWDDFEHLRKKHRDATFRLSSSILRYTQLRSLGRKQDSYGASTEDVEREFILDECDFTNDERISDVLSERDLFLDDTDLFSEKNDKHSTELFKRLLGHVLLRGVAQVKSGDAEMKSDAEMLSAVTSPDGVLTVTSLKKMPKLQLQQMGSTGNYMIDETTERQKKELEAVREARDTSPSPSVASADSCDSLIGRLWTFTSPDDLSTSYRLNSSSESSEDLQEPSGER